MGVKQKLFTSKKEFFALTLFTKEGFHQLLKQQLKVKLIRSEKS